MAMQLIVGLGNPGAKYEGTRHNIGFQVLDYLAENNNLRFSDSKWRARVVKANLWGKSLLLVKPETFMNESGIAVGRIAGYYRVAIQDVIVIHDDLDLEVARVKIVVNRGAGGHNGIASLISHLGGREFPRVRVGIGRPPKEIPASEFVLARFNSAEQKIIAEKLSEIAHDIKLIVENGPVAAMGLVNRKSQGLNGEK